MGTELPLFDLLQGSPALARTTDPETSYEAAESFDTTALENKVFQVIRMAGDEGCIADDVYRALPDIRQGSISPRFAPLKSKGLIRVIGKRPGETGRNQQIMKAICRCEKWARGDMTLDGHHPRCDGTGKWKGFERSVVNG